MFLSLSHTTHRERTTLIRVCVYTLKTNKVNQPHSNKLCNISTVINCISEYEMKAKYSVSNNRLNVTVAELPLIDSFQLSEGNYRFNAVILEHADQSNKWLGGVRGDKDL